MPRDRRIELPHINPWLMNGFEKHFLSRYLRKHFHVIAANRSSLNPAIVDNNTSLVIYCNHASWWDPMLAIFLRSQLFPAHKLYAPIDAVALKQYKIFKSMGFYGIDSTHRGAAEFLKRSMAILQAPGSSIWLTPEGKFCDPRQLDTPLQPGLSHLAHAIERASSDNAEQPNVWFVPAGIEYAFWEEPSPECLCWFGEPCRIPSQATQSRSKQEWQELLSAHLREAQRQLATASIARDTSPFEVLLRGKAGSGGLYDWTRRSIARLRGRPVTLEHSRLWK